MSGTDGINLFSYIFFRNRKEDNNSMGPNPE